jgi:hypothetical protein
MMSEVVVTVEPNRPQQPKPSNTKLNWLQINIVYFKSIPGILKLIQLIIGILCMALASPAYISATHFFLFVVVTSFIATILWCFVYFLGIREVLNLPINWILTELLNTFIIAVLYLIAIIVQLTGWSGYVGGSVRGANIAAGVFGIFNTIAYAAGSYFLYIEHKSSTTT